MAIKPLSTRQRKGIIFLLSERSVPAAAAKAGVGQRTLHRWLRDPVFLAELRSAEGQLLDQATRRLLQMQGGSLDVLDGLISDIDVDNTNRRLAAQTVLTILLKIRELVTLEERVNELERKVYEEHE